MGLFDKAKRSLGFQDESLRERGVKGTATVIENKKTMMSDDDGVYVYKTTVLVTVPGSEPYEVAYKAEGGLTKGAEYAAYVDREDPNRIFVERADREERIGRAADALHALAAAGVSGTPGVTTAVPGLSPEWQEMMAKNAATALSFVQDPAQRKMLIEQYRAAGIVVDEIGRAHV